MPMLCFSLCPNKPPFPGCSLWTLIFPIELSHQLKHIIFCSSWALGGSFLTFSFSSPWRGWEEKKKPSCFQGKRCNSHSFWRLRIKLVVPGRGFLHVFSFPKAVSQPLHQDRTVRATWAQCGRDVEPQSPWHCCCWEPEHPRAAQQHPGPLANIPSLLSRVVLLQRNSGETSETIRESRETAQSNLAKINTNQKPNKAKKPHLNKEKEPNTNQQA